MATSNENRTNNKIKFILFAFVLSGMLCILQQQIFTAQSFAETVVFISSATYLLLKYLSSKKILQYQKGNYHPAKWERKKDDLLINTTAHIVLPVCTDLIYACSILIVLKYLPTIYFRSAARVVVTVSDFNHAHIKFPMLIAGIIVAVLTLTNWLSEKFYKKYKKITKGITTPLRIVAILLFFINADTGVETRKIEYALHEHKVEKTAKVTFNASRQQEEKIQQTAQAFIDDITQGVDIPTDIPAELTDSQITSDDSYNEPEIPASSDEIVLIIDHAQQVYEQRPDFKTDFHFEDENFSEEEKSEIETIFREPTHGSAAATPDFVPNSLYNQAYSKPVSFYDEVLSALNDDKTSIHVKTEESTAKKILKDYLGEVLGKTWLFDALPKSIHFPGLLNCGIFKDKVFSLVKNKITDGFFLLVSGKDGSLQRTKSISSYLRTNLKNAILDCINKLKSNTLLAKRYYASLHNKFINWKTATFDDAHPTSDITYEDGLRKKQAIRDELLHEEEKVYTAEYWKQKILEVQPGMHGEELEENIRYNMDRVSKKVNEMIQADHEILTQKKYTDFEFIKNQYTSGGIFFGKSLDSTSTMPFAYYPPLHKPGTFQYLAPSTLWIKKQQDEFQLFIKTSKGVFELNEPVNAGLFLTAYRFVFDPNTYPTLIDIFHDYEIDKPVVEVPAFHKSFVHNEPIKQLIHTADKFIFDVLDNKINSPLIDRLLKGSRAAYKAERDNFKKHAGYSRLFDISHVLCSENADYFSLHSNIFLSVVQTTVQEGHKLPEVSKYKEINSISDGFNINKTALINAYPYLQQIHTLASYQALLRAVKRNNVDILELFSK